MDTPHLPPDEAKGEPLWRRIERVLQSEIAAGLLPPGARLASEPELASRFAAHRHTVRRAVAALAQRGLVRVEQGRGSFVHDDVIAYSVGPRTRVEENLLRQNRAFSGRLLSATEQVADPAQAQLLALRGRARRVLIVETLNEANGLPVSLVRHVLPAGRFKDFPAAYVTAGGSMTEALAACGVPNFTRQTTRISTRLPTVEEARILRQPQVLPVLVSESVDAEPGGAPFKLGVACFAGARVQLVLGS